MNQRERITLVTRDDCEWTYARGSGPGGQHRNKTATAVTVKHPPSGAVGHASESKSQWENRRTAFRRMAETPAFKRWVQVAVGRRMAVEDEVAQAMAPGNLKVEVREDGRWVEATL